MNLSKTTAERMLKNIDIQLQALAAEQQSMNGNVGGQKMRKGGRVKMRTLGEVPTFGNAPQLNWQPNLVPGGYTQRQGSWMNGIQGFGNDPYKINFGLDRLQMPNLSAVPHYGGNDGYGTAGAPNSTPVAITDKNLSAFKASTDNLLKTNVDPYALRGAPKVNVGQQSMSLPQGNGFGFNDALGLLPTAFNAVAGLTQGKADVIDPNMYQNPYESQAFGMMPSQFRVDDMLNDNRNAYGTYLRNVNQTGNSRGERMANYGAGMNRMNDANTRAWALKNNQENAMATNKAELRNNQGNVRAGINLKVRDMNDANAAAARNRRMAYLGAAATGAQTYGLTQEQMSNQSASQDAYIKALLRLNPYMGQWLGLENKG